MGTWNRDWRDAVRKRAHVLSVRNYNGELVGLDLETAIIDLVQKAADQREKRERPVLRIVRNSYQPEVS